jgi:hypothetical protein
MPSPKPKADDDQAPVDAPQGDADQAPAPDAPEAATDAPTGDQAQPPPADPAPVDDSDPFAGAPVVPEVPGTPRPLSEALTDDRKAELVANGVVDDNGWYARGYPARD